MEFSFYGTTGSSNGDTTSIELAGFEKPIHLPTILLDKAGVVVRRAGQDVIVGINELGLVTDVAPAPRATELEVS